MPETDPVITLYTSEKGLVTWNVEQGDSRGKCTSGWTGLIVWESIIGVTTVFSSAQD